MNKGGLETCEITTKVLPFVSCESLEREEKEDRVERI